MEYSTASGTATAWCCKSSDRCWGHRARVRSCCICYNHSPHVTAKHWQMNSSIYWLSDWSDCQLFYIVNNNRCIVYNKSACSTVSISCIKEDIPIKEEYCLNFIHWVQEIPIKTSLHLAPFFASVTSGMQQNKLSTFLHYKTFKFIHYMIS